MKRFLLIVGLRVFYAALTFAVGMWIAMFIPNFWLSAVWGGLVGGLCAVFLFTGYTDWIERDEHLNAKEYYK